MLVKRVTTLLKIQPEEIRLVSLVAALFLCLQAGGGLGDNAATALFLLRFGANYLPYMYIALGGLNFILAIAYATGLGRFQKDRFFAGLLSGFAILILLERLAALHPFPALYPVLWLTISGMGLILGTFIWNLAGEVCDARQAKRLFPLFTSAGILGSVLGNSITGIMAGALGTENLLILQAGLLGLVLLLTLRIRRAYFKPVRGSAGGGSLWDDLRVGYDFVHGSALMKLIAYASILFSILFFGIAFPFSKVVSVSFPDAARVAGFLGLFSSITTAVTFLVSLFAANRLYARLGIVKSVLLLPITYIFGFGFFAFNYNLIGAATARFTQLVMLSGAGDGGWNALFNVVPSQKRGQVLAFQNGVPAQIGVILSGVLLILGERLLSTPQIFLMCGCFAVICGFVVWRMRGAYAEALLGALRAGRVEVFSAQESAFTAIKTDPFAISVAVQSLHDSKSTTRRLAAEILGKMGAASAVPALVKALSDPEGMVRCAALGSLGELRAQSALKDILSCLDDGDPDVRISALRTLPQIAAEADPDLLTRVEGLLRDPQIKVRMQAALTLAKYGLIEQGVPVLIEQFNQGGSAHQLLALEMLGEIAASPSRTNGQIPFDVGPILNALDHPSAAIRKLACRALRDLDDGAILPGLIKCLYDKDSAVRQAASGSLRASAHCRDPILLEVLRSNDVHAQDAALEVIALDGTTTRSALLDYVRSQSSAIRFLRHQLMHLAPGGRSGRLLQETIQNRISSHEQHLITTVGIFGDQRAMELVRRSVHAADHETRAAALETLETLGSRELTREILPLLENGPLSPSGGGPSSSSGALGDLLSYPDEWICVFTIGTISESGSRTFIPRLRELQSDPRPLVAQSAGAALIQFGEEKSMDTLQTISTLERILLLREVPIFSDLSPEDLKQVADIAREQWLPDGATLCRAGEDGNAMYIIVSGKVRVQKEADGDERDLAVRAEGDFVGEMAIVDSAPRMATLRALGELRVLVIDSQSFIAILHDRPEVSIAMMRTLSRRLREMVQ
ncbi:MAG TPA: HEAT repeat domain-containing protein [Anaerolineales bacterium]|nr:HEAT repeat domain-containing protein [Anaerolineales bacterium]